MNGSALGFLLSYFTLATAGIAFILLATVMIIKRKALNRKEKVLFVCLLAVLALYYVFIICVTFAAGANQPATGPVPIAP